MAKRPQVICTRKRCGWTGRRADLTGAPCPRCGSDLDFVPCKPRREAVHIRVLPSTKAAMTAAQMAQVVDAHVAGAS